MLGSSAQADAAASPPRSSAVRPSRSRLVRGDPASASSTSPAINLKQQAASSRRRREGLLLNDEPAEERASDTASNASRDEIESDPNDAFQADEDDAMDSDPEGTEHPAGQRRAAKARKVPGDAVVPRSKKVTPSGTELDSSSSFLTLVKDHPSAMDHQIAMWHDDFQTEYQAVDPMVADLTEEGVPVLPSMARLVNLVLETAGCQPLPESVTELNDEDVVRQELVRQQNVLLKQKSDFDYPLFHKAKGLKGGASGRKFKVSFEEFWVKWMTRLIHQPMWLRSLGAHTDMDDTEWAHWQRYDPLTTLRLWTTIMSVSSFRPMRHTGTTVTLSLATALAEHGGSLVKTQEILSRKIAALEAQLAKGSGSRAKRQERPQDAQLKALQEEQQSTQQQRQQVEKQLQDIYGTVFIHRYRDVDPVLRTDCIAHLGRWLHAFPAYFMNANYLRYLGWLINDKAVGVRREAIRTMDRLTRIESHRPAMTQLLERFKQRLVDMALRDVDLSVRVSATDVAVTLVQLGVLTDAERDLFIVCNLICADDSRMCTSLSDVAVTLYQDAFANDRAVQARVGTGSATPASSKRRAASQRGASGGAGDPASAGDAASWLTLAKFVLHYLDLTEAKRGALLKSNVVSAQQIYDSHLGLRTSSGSGRVSAKDASQGGASQSASVSQADAEAVDEEWERDAMEWQATQSDRLRSWFRQIEGAPRSSNATPATTASAVLPSDEEGIGSSLLDPLAQRNDDVALLVHVLHKTNKLGFMTRLEPLLELLGAARFVADTEALPRVASGAVLTKDEALVLTLFVKHTSSLLAQAAGTQVQKHLDLYHPIARRVARLWEQAQTWSSVLPTDSDDAVTEPLRGQAIAHHAMAHIVLDVMSSISPVVWQEFRLEQDLRDGLVPALLRTYRSTMDSHLLGRIASALGSVMNAEDKAEAEVAQATSAAAPVGGATTSVYAAGSALAVFGRAGLEATLPLQLAIQSQVRDLVESLLKDIATSRQAEAIPQLDAALRRLLPIMSMIDMTTVHFQGQSHSQSDIVASGEGPTSSSDALYDLFTQVLDMLLSASGDLPGTPHLSTARDALCRTLEAMTSLILWWNAALDDGHAPVASRASEDAVEAPSEETVVSSMAELLRVCEALLLKDPTDPHIDYPAQYQAARSMSLLYLFMTPEQVKAQQRTQGEWVQHQLMVHIDVMAALVGLEANPLRLGKLYATDTTPLQLAHLLDEQVSMHHFVLTLIGDVAKLVLQARFQPTTLGLLSKYMGVGRATFGGSVTHMEIAPVVYDTLLFNDMWGEIWSQVAERLLTERPSLGPDMLGMMVVSAMRGTRLFLAGAVQNIDHVVVQFQFALQLWRKHTDITTQPVVYKALEVLLMLLPRTVQAITYRIIEAINGYDPDPSLDYKQLPLLADAAHADAVARYWKRYDEDYCPTYPRAQRPRTPDALRPIWAVFTAYLHFLQQGVLRHPVLAADTETQTKTRTLMGQLSDYMERSFTVEGVRPTPRDPAWSEYYRMRQMLAGQQPRGLGGAPAALPATAAKSTKSKSKAAKAKTAPRKKRRSRITALDEDDEDDEDAAASTSRSGRTTLSAAMGLSRRNLAGGVISQTPPAAALPRRRSARRSSGGLARGGYAEAGSSDDDDREHDEIEEDEEPGMSGLEDDAGETAMKTTQAMYAFQHERLDAGSPSSTVDAGDDVTSDASEDDLAAPAPPAKKIRRVQI